MNFEQAQGIIQRMAYGTVTPEEETQLEAWALEEWGYTPQNGERVVILSETTPDSAGQSQWRSVRQCLEWCRETAQNWCDVRRFHTLLGWTSYDGYYYDQEVYTYGYTEKIERPFAGNVVKMECWKNETYKTLVSFRCAEEQVKDVRDYDHDDTVPHYLFEHLVQCEKCFAIKAFPVLCQECLKRAIEHGDCVVSEG